MSRRKSGCGGILFPLLILIAIIGIIINANTDDAPIPDSSFPDHSAPDTYETSTTTTVTTQTTAKPTVGTTVGTQTTPDTRPTAKPTTGAVSTRPSLPPATKLSTLPSHRRMYLQLNDIEKDIYDKLYRTVVKGELSYSFNNIDVPAYKDGMKRAVNALYADFPEFFWLNSGYSYQSNDNIFGHYINVKLSCYEYWTYTADKQGYINKVFRAADEIAAKAAVKSSTYDKVKYVHDYLIKNVSYNHATVEAIQSGTSNADSQQSHTVYGALINKTPVCDGYAKTFQFIMNILGIECEYYEGDTDGDPSNGVGHAWNYIKLDGQYYWMDVTWDDADFENYPLAVEYDYFCITTEQLYRTHVPHFLFTEPQCTADAYNFFTKENAHVDHYSLSAVSKAIESQLDEAMISVRFSSAAQLERALDDLFKTGNNHSRLPGRRVYSYSHNPKHYVLKIFYK